MSTFDKSGGSTGVIPQSGQAKSYVISNKVDLSGGALTGGDVYQFLAIPANTLVESVHLLVNTPAVGTTLTMNTGDGGATNGWMASTDGKATAGTYDHSTAGTDARSVAANNGYFYSAADTIDIVMTTATAITAGPVITLFAVCYDLNYV